MHKICFYITTTLKLAEEEKRENVCLVCAYLLVGRLVLLLVVVVAVEVVAVVAYC